MHRIYSEPKLRYSTETRPLSVAGMSILLKYKERQNGHDSYLCSGEEIQQKRAFV